MSVIAYRAWNVAPGLGILTPANVDITHDPQPRDRCWASSTITAKCRERRHRAPIPSPRCTCGIYAWKRPVDPDLTNHWTAAPAANVAVGVVQMWGRMCDGPKATGYRAQHARIVALVADPAGNLDRSRYPDVAVYPDLLTMYSEWDTTPELGFAADAHPAEGRQISMLLWGGTDRCISCGDTVNAGEEVVKYDGRNPWVDGREVPALLHRRPDCVLNPGPRQQDPGRFFCWDREWAYANRQPRKLLP
ncbi:hypothetical protein [Parafrankia sp. FMc2]|uniref:hypothetical protein n=1 Tax=Parafrankia sp. FMc2 TaxID=3233196 RepID=UPI0034D5FD9B